VPSWAVSGARLPPHARDRVPRATISFVAPTRSAPWVRPAQPRLSEECTARGPAVVAVAAVAVAPAGEREATAAADLRTASACRFLPTAQTDVRTCRQSLKPKEGCPLPSVRCRTLARLPEPSGRRKSPRTGLGRTFFSTSCNHRGPKLHYGLQTAIPRLGASHRLSLHRPQASASGPISSTAMIVSIRRGTGSDSTRAGSS
jgi:hypothetical protein